MRLVTALAVATLAASCGQPPDQATRLDFGAVAWACPGVTPVREPDAGKPRVQFDEEG